MIQRRLSVLPASRAAAEQAAIHFRVLEVLAGSLASGTCRLFHVNLEKRSYVPLVYPAMLRMIRGVESRDEARSVIPGLATDFVRTTN